MVTGTSTIEAPAARSRCHESSRPIGALIAAMRRRDRHHRRQPLGHQGRRGRWRHQHPEHQQRADDAKADDDGERDHDQHHELQAIDRQAEGGSSLPVEGEQQERPVQHRDQGEDQRP